jgi:hypothetical protein
MLSAECVLGDVVSWVRPWRCCQLSASLAMLSAECVLGDVVIWVRPWRCCQLSASLAMLSTEYVLGDVVSWVRPWRCCQPVFAVDVLSNSISVSGFLDRWESDWSFPTEWYRISFRAIWCSWCGVDTCYMYWMPILLQSWCCWSLSRSCTLKGGLFSH